MKITIEGTATEIATLVLELQELQLVEDCPNGTSMAIRIDSGPAQWTGILVGLMHNHRISNAQLAEQLGLTDRYVSMVLNGHRDPPGAEERFTAAVHKIIEEKRTATG